MLFEQTLHSWRYHCAVWRMLSAVRNIYISEGLPFSLIKSFNASVLSLLISQLIKKPDKCRQARQQGSKKLRKN